MKLESLLGESNFLHIWGQAGTGKTLLATALAAQASRLGIVEYINTDGKRSFIRALKRHTSSFGGLTSRIRVTLADGASEAFGAVRSVASSVSPETSMVVVDPITRVLDMSTVDDVMWGQEMMEEVLPSLVALAEGGIRVLVVSEVRNTDVGLLPVMYDSVNRWKPRNLRATRGPGRHSTLMLPTPDGEEVLALMRVDDRGCLWLDYPAGAHILSEGEQSCLERQSCV